MVETATPSPQPTPESPRPETTPSFLGQMEHSIRQFAEDVTRANEDAREQLGRSAVGHMLSGVAPLATGVVGEVVLEKLFVKMRPAASDEGQRKGKASPLSLLTDVVGALDGRQFLREVAKNVGITVAYNQMVAKPSEGALPLASAVDAGIAVGLDAAAIGVENIAKTARVRQTVDWLKVTDNETSLRARSVSGFTKGGRKVVEGAKLANGPTMLGLRMTAEGVAALVKNYKAIVHARNHPNEPKPYHPPERKPWERGDRGGRRDFNNRGRDRVYYGQGRGRYDRQHR